MDTHMYLIRGKRGPGPASCPRKRSAAGSGYQRKRTKTVIPDRICLDTNILLGIEWEDPFFSSIDSFFLNLSTPLRAVNQESLTQAGENAKNLSLSHLYFDIFPENRVSAIVGARRAVSLPKNIIFQSLKVP